MVFSVAFRFWLFKRFLSGFGGALIALLVILGFPWDFRKGFPKLVCFFGFSKA